jgi:putative membrane protein
MFFVINHFGFLNYNHDYNTLAVVAVVLGIFNSFLRPFLLAIFLIVSIPILIVTLGLGAYIVLFLTNGAILALTDKLLSNFEVNQWAYATITISVCSWFLTSAVGIDQLKPLRRAQAAKEGKEPPKDVIDI